MHRLGPPTFNNNIFLNFFYHRPEGIIHANISDFKDYFLKKFDFSSVGWGAGLKVYFDFDPTIEKI